MTSKYMLITVFSCYNTEISTKMFETYKDAFDAMAKDILGNTLYCITDYVKKIDMNDPRYIRISDSQEFGYDEKTAWVYGNGAKYDWKIVQI